MYRERGLKRTRIIASDYKLSTSLFLMTRFKYLDTAYRWCNHGINIQVSWSRFVSETRSPLIFCNTTLYLLVFLDKLKVYLGYLYTLSRKGQNQGHLGQKYVFFMLWPETLLMSFFDNELLFRNSSFRLSTYK